MIITVYLIVMYCFLALLVVATGHWALYHDAGAWPLAVLFAAQALICGFFIIHEELADMKLPKIAALDLRPIAKTPQATNDTSGPWPLLPFPDGWYASS